ncbi:MAG: ECF-type sigma factor [Planctomycetaceae bacterium]
MQNVTQILKLIDQGKETAAADLLPLVYGELRKLARQRLTNEKASASIQATVLVHDAFVRLVDKEHQQKWSNRGHFFGAAAEAMRRILIERARRRQTEKHGGGHQKISLVDYEAETEQDAVDVLALNEVLSDFEDQWPEKSQLVKLRYFAGLTIADSAAAMGISDSTAERYWRFARAWLFSRLEK